MSIFDITTSNKITNILQEGRVLSGAIYEIYKEADKKREELLKTVNPEVVKYALPSYRDLRKELFIDKNSQISHSTHSYSKYYYERL